MADASISELFEYEGTGPLPDEAQFIAFNPAVGKDRRVSADRVRETMATPPGTPAQVTAEQVYAFLKAGTGISITLQADGKILISNSSPATQGVKAPVAPTGWITDDTADTGSGLLVPGYPALSDYEAFGVPGLAGTVPATSVPGADVQNGRLTLRGLTGAIPVGGVGFRVAASGNRPAGASLTNNTPYTASGTTTPGPGGTITPGATIGTPGILVHTTTSY